MIRILVLSQIEVYPIKITTKILANHCQKLMSNFQKLRENAKHLDWPETNFEKKKSREFNTNFQGQLYDCQNQDSEGVA